jgi:hypothetical protein
MRMASTPAAVGFDSGATDIAAGQSQTSSDSDCVASKMGGAGCEARCCSGLTEGTSLRCYSRAQSAGTDSAYLADWRPLLQDQS